uniref:Uncharacterized protein n=1 Tax=Pseudonaja textilis TaxID=8673 RepID=A0A670ZTG5_PSETE
MPIPKEHMSSSSSGSDLDRENDTEQTGNSIRTVSSRNNKEDKMFHIVKRAMSTFHHFKVSRDYGEYWMDQGGETKLNRKSFSLYPEQGTLLKEWITDINEVKKQRNNSIRAMSEQISQPSLQKVEGVESRKEHLKPV